MAPALLGDSGVDGAGIPMEILVLADAFAVRPGTEGASVVGGDLGRLLRVRCPASKWVSSRPLDQWGALCCGLEEVPFLLVQK